MKVVAINGSPRANGNTALALEMMGEVFKENNIELEIITIGNDTIKGCQSCGYCAKMKEKKCVINDRVNSDLELLENADGIILASPVYFAGVNGTMKAYLDRLFYVSSSNGNLFRHKVGTSLAIARREGGIPTADTLDYYLKYSEMLLASSNYWNTAYGAGKGEIKNDLEGVQIFQTLAENFTYLLKMREATKSTIIPKEKVKKTYFNFIR